MDACNSITEQRKIVIVDEQSEISLKDVPDEDVDNEVRKILEEVLEKFKSKSS